jgi:hypothetical protein
MAPVSKELRRRVARTLEWFIVGQMAKGIPPADRLFLLYEVAPGVTKHDARIRRARKNHGRGGFCIGEFTLVTIDRASLAKVVGWDEWMEARVDGGSPLAPNEARCIVILDGPEEPEIVIFNARSVHHQPNRDSELEDA